MSITIGRVGTDPTRRLACPGKWDLTGDVVSLSGTFGASDLPVSGGTDDLDSALAMRRQLSGYPSDDEPVVPVVFNEDPSVTGWYRVNRLAVSMLGESLLHGYFAYDAELVRVPGFAAPEMESIVTGAIAANSFGLVVPLGFHAVPASVDDYGFAPGGGSFQERQSADGPVLYVSTGASATFVANYSLDPADAYIGAALLRVGGANPVEIVVGRQAVNEPRRWVVTNGIVRVRSSASGTFEVSTWDSGAWRSTKRYQIEGLGAPGDYPAGKVVEWTHLTVLRNSPEEVALRLSCRVAGGPTRGRVRVDLRVRRGDRLVRCYVSADRTDQFKVGLVTPEAATALTGAIRATADDGDGNWYLIGSTTSFSSDLANGSITQAGYHSTFDFVVGHVLGGSSTVIVEETAAGLYQQYLTEQSERQVVVGR